MQKMIDFLGKMRAQDAKRKRTAIIVVAVILIVFGGYFIETIISGNRDQGEILGESVEETVTTMIIGEGNNDGQKITVSGLVQADSRIDIVALNSGTVTNVNFEIGDKVAMGQVLAQLHNDVATANFSSASSSYTSAQQSYSIVSQLVEDGVLQAQIGVQNAIEIVTQAETGLKASELDYANAIALQEKTTADTKNNAVVSYYSYLDTAHSALDQVNYIIKEEGNSQLAGISGVLSVLDHRALDRAKIDYRTAKDEYNKIILNQIGVVNVEENLSKLSNLLSLTKTAVDSTITVLDNTIPSSDFPIEVLNAQKSSFSVLRQNVIGTQAGVQATYQQMQNLDLVNQRELDALQAGVDSAKNQLRIANLTYDNAVSALSSANRNKDQQLINASMSLSVASSQFQIASSQYNDLSVKAPIDGEVTYKNVQVGAEVTAGKKIAEIVQDSMVKIVLSLSSDDAYRVEVGSEVMINNKYKAIVTQVAPAADLITRKITIEVVYDNKNNDLIPDTFVDVELKLKQEIADDENIILIVPLKAVTISQTEKYVFIYNEGKAQKRLVETGKINGQEIEILSGLQFGDELILEGSKSVEEGQEVGRK